jgi:hypothetical protein
MSKMINKTNISELNDYLKINSMTKMINKRDLKMCLYFQYILKLYRQHLTHSRVKMVVYLKYNIKIKIKILDV